MKIDYPLWKIASNDFLRPALMHVKITKRHAFSTDGRIMAIVPIKLDDDDIPGMVRADAFPGAIAAGANQVTLGAETLGYAVDGVITETSRIRPEGRGETFPKLGHIFRPLFRRKAVYRVGLRPSLLLKLANAIQAHQGVELEFGEDPKSPILVKPITYAEDNKAIGVLMPISLRGSL